MVGNYFRRIPFPAWMRAGPEENTGEIWKVEVKQRLLLSNVQTPGQTHTEVPRRGWLALASLSISAFFLDCPADSRDPVPTSIDLDTDLLVCFPRSFPEHPLISMSSHLSTASWEFSISLDLPT